MNFLSEGSMGRVALAIVLALSMSACATQEGYREAFASNRALEGNSRVFQAAQEEVWRAAKSTLVKQGFALDQADNTLGLIKATRDLEDKDDPTVSYTVNATVSLVAETPSPSAAAAGDKPAAALTAATGSAPAATTVLVAATEQTVLHRKWRDWWHLFFIIPLFPIGTEYQTVVTHEGNITDPNFYADFFDAVQKQIWSAGSPPVKVAPNAPVAVTPNPPKAAVPNPPKSVAPSPATAVGPIE